MSLLFLIGICFLLGWAMPYLTSSLGMRRWKKEADLLLAQALLEKQKLLQETEIEVLEKRRGLSDTFEKERHVLLQHEKNLQQQNELLKKREEELHVLSQRLEEKRKKADARVEDLQKKELELEHALMNTAHLTQEEAKQHIMHTLREELEVQFLQHKTPLIQERIEEEKRKISHAFEDALRATYTTLTSHSHISILHIPDEAVLPRLIGKEGRNIEGLSTLLGCDLWIDDERQELLLCSYDDMKRFIAERTLKELFTSATFTVRHAASLKKEMSAHVEKECAQKGIETLQALSLPNIYPEPVVTSLGSLSLRSSQGQNVLLHSLEVATMARLAAQTLDIHSDLVVQIGLFHDIGKALDTSWSGRHPERGQAFLAHHGLPKKLCEGVALHHATMGHTSLEAMIIPYLDALSARGCAKRLLQHITPFKRVQQQLEALPGIDAAWCIDSQTKILLLLRTNTQPLDMHALESLLQKETPHSITEAHFLSRTGTSPYKTMIFLPKKN